jgi:hypothetical protein
MYLIGPTSLPDARRVVAVMRQYGAQSWGSSDPSTTIDNSYPTAGTK